MFGFGKNETKDSTEATGVIPVHRGGLIAFLKRRINPLAADREEKFARLEARVASGVATGDQFNQLGDMKQEKGLRDDALDLYKSACDQFLEEDLVVKSIAVIKKIVKQFPEDACATEMYVRLGDLNQRRGMVANAKEAYLAAAQRYQEHGAIRDALGVFQRLADLLPDNVELNADLGRMYAKEGMKAEASTQYGRTAQRLIEMGDLRRARELCLSSLGQKAGNRDALRGLLHIALVEEDYAEADAYMGHLSDYVESDWELLKAYGDLLAHQGRVEEATIQYQKASALNPMNQELEQALHAVSHARLPAPEVTTPVTTPVTVAGDGEMESAPVIELDDQAVAGFDPTCLAAIGEVEVDVPEAAVDEAAEEGADEGGGPAAVELEDYTALFDQGTAGEAEGVAPATVAAATEGEGVGESAPPVVDEAEVERQLTEARFYEEIGMGAEATAVWRSLMEVIPDHPQVVAAMARLGLGTLSPAATIPAVATPAAPIAAAEVADLLAEADIYVAGTLFHEAIAIYERILAGVPGQGDAAAGLKQARQLAGDPGLQKEEKLFEDGIERQMTHLLADLVGEDDGVNEDPALHLELASSYLEMGMVEEALAEARVATQADTPPAAAFLLLGRCYVMRDEGEAAVTALQIFLSRAADSAETVEARYELALLHLERGESAAAHVQLQQIEAASPGYRDVATLLAGCAR
ncbi:MAG: tetratricopeptide repeat protein [Deltaproteobacteria bacterium]|nr:tetratricopeptide repeat protein [Deltaproteobacteria bacterium]NCS72909.1 tetratricopeptide repeat protein [Deltaproteobacteria bacterium]OIP66636.1 MAG: hypothetical protein AUK30_02090 [Nitrospirae bacterium CG2_30_70_394]PIU79128.1 MAG: hypothetical protein COS73_05065 [Nitrospirae bacterium CG06_land_8_20_14_3_00_70_43]PJB95808.1 MAG: hypothetical protein CO080_05815 [Nitrospirae bacterium CG_4_9_14_0_8_um_filter_70_14]